MRLIDADKLKEHLNDIYTQNGFKSSEIHFSLRDMENNIDGEETVFEYIDMIRIEESTNLTWRSQSGL